MDSLGARIKRARERARMTQRELAEALGVDPKTVDNWENGRTTPKSSLGALEQVLGPYGLGVEGDRPAGDRAVVLQVIEIMKTDFKAETKLVMIEDVINRDFIPDGADEEERLAG